MTTTVVSVSTKPLADSDFEVPAGYKEISMPTLTPTGARGSLACPAPLVPVDPGNPPADAPALVLASTSPRRRLLLAAHGYAARVEPAPVEELAVDWLSVRELVVAQRGPQVRRARGPGNARAAVVLGVDTLVCLDGRRWASRRIWRKPPRCSGGLSGRAHQVYSGVCLAMRPRAGRCVSSRKRGWCSGPLDAAEIDAYLRLVNPLDKAGGYAAQEHGERIIARYEGSWSNVMGLPMETLADTLAREFGIHPALGP